MIIKGIPAPTIGNICMDMTILDITGIDANEDDEVIVFGPLNPVTDMAGILQTIPYEVLTSISPRVKRIYQFD
jgi:alanine racemase